jgi:hydrogenase nickel incorporation protein HypA/HybF
MHELSIAEALVSIATRHAAGRRVTAVEVKVGHLRQVVPSALEFAFELVAVGTVVEKAELRLEEVPARGRCRSCDSDSAIDCFPMVCGRCGGLDLEVTAGEELLVDALELDEEARDTAVSPGLSRAGDELTTIGGRR